LLYLKTEPKNLNKII